MTGSSFLLTGVDHTTHTGTHAMQIATHTHICIYSVSVRVRAVSRGHYSHQQGSQEHVLAIASSIQGA